jgi:hypothetical protein
MEDVNLKFDMLASSKMTDTGTFVESGIESILSIFFNYLSPAVKWRLLNGLLKSMTGSSHQKSNSIIIPKGLNIPESDLRVIIDFYIWIAKTSPFAFFSESQEEWMLFFNQS